jgi:hypothetical protein
MEAVRMESGYRVEMERAEFTGYGGLPLMRECLTGRKAPRRLRLVALERTDRAECLSVFTSLWSLACPLIQTLHPLNLGRCTWLQRRSEILPI